jgi:hypothetical protein
MLPAEFYVIQDAVLTHVLTHKHRFGILTNVKSKFLSFSFRSEAEFSHSICPECVLRSK